MLSNIFIFIFFILSVYTNNYNYYDLMDQYDIDREALFYDGFSVNLWVNEGCMILMRSQNDDVILILIVFLSM